MTNKELFPFITIIVMIVMCFVATLAINDINKQEIIDKIAVVGVEYHTHNYGFLPDSLLVMTKIQFKAYTMHFVSMAHIIGEVPEEAYDFIFKLIRQKKKEK